MSKKLEARGAVTNFAQGGLKILKSLLLPVGANTHSNHFYSFIIPVTLSESSITLKAGC